MHGENTSTILIQILSLLKIVELNLRLTGTTHPFLSTKLLTNGETDPDTGLFVAGGQPKYYVSSDHIEDHSLKRLVPQDVYELMMKSK